MEQKCDSCSKYAPLLLRISLGLLFILPGFQKLANPEMIIGMLGGLGFPAAGFFGWLLILIEIIFGFTILIGWKLRKTVWPLVVILAIALFTVQFPAWFSKQPMAMISVLFHILGIAALISLHYSGPGAAAASKH